MILFCYDGRLNSINFCLSESSSKQVHSEDIVMVVMRYNMQHECCTSEVSEDRQQGK